MRRRELLLVLATGMIGAPAVRAQQKVMPVIGLLAPGSTNPPGPAPDAWRQALSEAGYVENQNVAIEYSFAEGHYDRLPALAADLVDRNVDVIAAFTTLAALAAKRATSTIPIVFVTGEDPVESGLVASFPKPGGNLTGMGRLNVELMPKRLELLSELVPQARVIALLVNPANSDTERIIEDMREAAGTRRVQLQILKAGVESEIDAAFASLAQLQAGAVIIGADVVFSSRRQQLFALAARFGIPVIYDGRGYAEDGGLISYGSSITDTYRQFGIYIGKILNGAKPADLPVQQPTRFELVVNLKTANALGLTVPPSILARADEVIE
jgi:putative tryptophan/tyrosine transport system substrate-binding protein